MKPKTVLILRPKLNDPGGVASYYDLVGKFFSSDSMSIDFFYVGKGDSTGFRSRIAKTVSDLFTLCKIFPRYDLVVLNPSLDLKSMLRDGVFHFAAKYIYARRTLLFFRGWSEKLESRIDRSWKSVFRFVFGADKVIVLSNRIKAKVTQWGCDPKDVIVETTTFEGKRCEDRRDPNRVVFLSRFVKEKGCMHAIKTIELLIPDFSSIHLVMAGDGILFKQLKNYVADNNLGDHITFTGYISGEEKYNVLSQCGIMLYPTFYGEGLPNSLLECMGMGLVPISRPVGGIKDVIADGKNGFLVESTNPLDFAGKIRDLLLDKEIWLSMSERNIRESWERYEARIVVGRLEKIFLECLQY